MKRAENTGGATSSRAAKLKRMRNMAQPQTEPAETVTQEEEVEAQSSGESSAERPAPQVVQEAVDTQEEEVNVWEEMEVNSDTSALLEAHHQRKIMRKLDMLTSLVSIMKNLRQKELTEDNQISPEEYKQRRKQVYEEFQRLVKAELKEGFKVLNIIYSAPTTEPSLPTGTVICPELVTSVCQMYKVEDLKPFEYSNRMGTQYPGNIRHLRIFPLEAETAGELDQFWETTVKFMEKHGKHIWGLEIAQVELQSATSFVDTLEKLLSLAPKLKALKVEGLFQITDLQCDWKGRLTNLANNLEMKSLEQVRVIWKQRPIRPSDPTLDVQAFDKEVNDYAKSNGGTIYTRFINLLRVRLSVALDTTFNKVESMEWAWNLNLCDSEDEEENDDSNEDSNEESSSSEGGRTRYFIYL